MKKIIVYISFVVLFVSCGYKFDGVGYVRDNISLISVKVLDNNTSQANAQIAFTNSLIQEIIEKSNTKVVDINSAQAVLDGSSIEQIRSSETLKENIRSGMTDIESVIADVFNRPRRKIIMD